MLSISWDQHRVVFIKKPSTLLKHYRMIYSTSPIIKNTKEVCKELNMRCPGKEVCQDQAAAKGQTTDHCKHRNMYRNIKHSQFYNHVYRNHSVHKHLVAKYNFAHSIQRKIETKPTVLHLTNNIYSSMIILY